MDYKCIDFISHGDNRGQLIAIEYGRELPFPVKRMYYIFDTLNGVRRGFHAHKSLKQLLICVSGSCKLHLEDGMTSEEIELNSPDRGILITGVIWREMYDFSPDAVLVVLASEVYAESDYIRDYEEFKKYRKGNYKNE